MVAFDNLVKLCHNEASLDQFVFFLNLELFRPSFWLLFWHLAITKIDAEFELESGSIKNIFSMVSFWQFRPTLSGRRIAGAICLFLNVNFLNQYYLFVFYSKITTLLHMKKIHLFQLF